MQKSFLRIAAVAIVAGVAIAGASCGRHGQKNAGSVPVFDIRRTSCPERQLLLQDIATVEYIPLETDAGFLLGEFPHISYIDKNVIVTNTDYIMFFDRTTGRALRSFSRKGRGPGEYLDISSLAVDAGAEELFVLENSISPGKKEPMHVYDWTGRHLRTIDIWREGFQDHFHVYDDGNLFFYNENVSRPTPYKLLSRTDTAYTFLPVAFPQRVSMDVSVDTGDGGGYTAHCSGTTVMKTAEGYIFSEPGVDTIYRWNRASGELTPLMARTPAFDSPEVPVVLFVTGESSDYLFLGVEERKEYEPGKSRKYDFQQLYYDKSDGQFYDGPIVNGDYVDEMTVDIYGIMSSSVAYPPGMFVNVIQAWTLVDLHGKGKLRGPLADLAATLKEDDNPVLMIATFK